MMRRPPRSTLFPTRRSSDLSNDRGTAPGQWRVVNGGSNGNAQRFVVLLPGPPSELKSDRKSTRLNSSHPSISYAVFCLKKKIKATREDGVRQHSAKSVETGQ